MHKLLLDLTIRRYRLNDGRDVADASPAITLDSGSENLVVFRTALRVFDAHSLTFAYQAVRLGYLGRWSKLSFFLEGECQYTQEDTTTKFIRFQMYSKGKDGRLIPTIPMDIVAVMPEAVARLEFAIGKVRLLEKSADVFPHHNFTEGSNNE